MTAEGAISDRSDVAFRRSSDPHAVLEFIERAEPVFGPNPIASGSENCAVAYDAYEFWPRWEQTDHADESEPDLVITIKEDNDADILVAIEAKLRAGKSSSRSEGKRVPINWRRSGYIFRKEPRRRTQFHGSSSSAWAKNAEVVFSISLARRSSLFSFLERFESLTIVRGRPPTPTLIRLSAPYPTA